ncbi:NAD(P)-binding protein [Hyaloscypha bicolor E]|uniref:NAD(P)-binding protein n=1 Tax=Hyaloscypha bicolor E TaxID=1095630 RepID=A0A2J6SGR6_9HELO|nr:NAD(P)-binding protein [Hyaloscypha bicolor E]PMD49949.1 NAD(P)-binding protein [Hyaloscypha bicolor E]
MPQLTWLITGCSSGFGEQFVSSILARGDHVIATGRDIIKLQNLKEAGASILQLDITSTQQAINETVAQAISIYGKVDVLLNNAGYVSTGIFEDLAYEDFLAQFETNIFGTIKVTQALLPQFRQRRAGTMVFIGSLSGWMGDPGISAYVGSKFALEGIVESLWRETSPLGIKTLLIEPGRFRTKLLSSGNMKTVSTEILEYKDFSRTLLKGLAEADQMQPGDPIKLVEMVLDLVRQEGIAEGKEIPFRLPLGSDCYNDVKAKCEETLELLKKWEPMIKSTDYE